MRVKEYNTLYNAEKIPTLEIKLSYNAPDYSKLDNPNVIADFMRKYLHANQLMYEAMWVLFLNTKCNLIGYTELNRGTINSSIIDNRRLFQMALQSGASNIILIHNHPSGDSTPSREDNMITEGIKSGCQLLGITLLDHIIVGEGFYSYKNVSNIL